jgi:hypothetical protein
MASSVQALLSAVVSQALSVLNAAGLAPVNGQVFAIPGTAGYDITWDVVLAGTALGTIQVDLQGSMDATFTNPVQLDTYNVVGNTGRHVTNKQMPFLRVRLVTATGGDPTSSVIARVYAKKRGAEI